MAKNRVPAVYCNAIEKILLTHIHQLVKAEGEGDEVGKFKNGEDNKEHMCVYEGDKDQDSIEISRNREEDEDCGEDDNNSQNMQTDEDEMDENGYDEDSECQCA